MNSVNPRWLGALLTLSFFISLVITAPAAVFVGRIADSASAVTFTSTVGTLWRGEVRGLSVADTPLGDISFSATLVHVAPFGPRVSWRSQNGTTRGLGTFDIGIFGPDRLTIESATLDLTMLPLRLPLTGQVQLSDMAVTTSGAGCVSAQGRVQLEGNLNAGITHVPLNLAGTPSCDDGVLSLILEGTANRNPMTTSFQLAGLNTLTTRVTADAINEMERIALMSYGFRQSGSRYELVETVQLP